MYLISVLPDKLSKQQQVLDRHVLQKKKKKKRIPCVTARGLANEQDSHLISLSHVAVEDSSHALDGRML